QHLTQLWFGLLPRPCLPLLHGHYTASSLLRRLCHAPGAVLRTCLTGHELRCCLPGSVIPHSRHSNFLPFHLQPPHTLPQKRSLSPRTEGCRSRLALRGSASDSRLRHS